VNFWLDLIGAVRLAAEWLRGHTIWVGGVSTDWRADYERNSVKR
jgi:hypothetical protein